MMTDSLTLTICVCVCVFVCLHMRFFWQNYFSYSIHGFKAFAIMQGFLASLPDKRDLKYSYVMYTTAIIGSKI